MCGYDTCWPSLRMQICNPELNLRCERLQNSLINIKLVCQITVLSVCVTGVMGKKTKNSLLSAV